MVHGSYDGEEMRNPPFFNNEVRSMNELDRLRAGRETFMEGFSEDLFERDLTPTQAAFAEYVFNHCNDIADEEDKVSLIDCETFATEVYPK